MTSMRQEAPYPEILGRLVASLGYKPGWRFQLVDDLDRGQGSRGLTLVINITGPNSYRPWEKISVNHYMPVPPAAYDERSWRRWLFDQVLLVERHEAMEFFALDGERPYAPHHQPGHDPYTVFEIGTREEADTDFRGNRVHSEVASPPQSDAGGSGGGA